MVTVTLHLIIDEFPITVQTIIFYSLLGLKNVAYQRMGKSVRLLFTKMMHACTRCALFGGRNWLQVRRGTVRVCLYTLDFFSSQSVIHFITVSVEWKPTSFNKKLGGGTRTAFFKKKKAGVKKKATVSEFQKLYRIKVHHLPLKQEKSEESKQQLTEIECFDLIFLFSSFSHMVSSRD